MGALVQRQLAGNEMLLASFMHIVYAKLDQADNGDNEVKLIKLSLNNVQKGG